MNLPKEMENNIRARLSDVQHQYVICCNLIEQPKGKNPERLEDELNSLQDAAYQARSAFKMGQVQR